jgi:threonine dehydrogenase-like Zn-dependent dehydrogenase
VNGNVRALPVVQEVPRFVGRGRISTWERPVPEPGDGELLLEVRANALCGTERSQLETGSSVTPGHEAAGVVAAAGPGTSTPLGTPGVVYLMDVCATCRSCRYGATNQCLAKRADRGFTHDGGYGAYELVSERQFFPVDPDLPLVEATLLLDVMGTTGHAIERARRIRDDIESVVVAGAGPVGLGCVVMARLLLGPDLPIVVTDVVPYRLDLATTLGARVVHLGTSTLAAGLHDAGLHDADIAIDTAGRARTRRDLLDVLGKRGVLICVGHGEELTINVSNDLIGPERAVLGSEYFRLDELPRNVQLLREHRMELAPIITHRFPATDLEAAFTLFLSGATGKVVVER